MFIDRRFRNHFLIYISEWNHEFIFFDRRKHTQKYTAKTILQMVNFRLVNDVHLQTHLYKRKTHSYFLFHCFLIIWSYIFGCVTTYKKIFHQTNWWHHVKYELLKRALSYPVNHIELIKSIMYSISEKLYLSSSCLIE